LIPQAIGSRRQPGDAGQSLLELAMLLPMMLVLVFGVVDISAELLDDHIVTRLSREGSNMISRDTSLQDATTAMKLMTSGPVNFDNGTSKLILSVFKRVATTGAPNYNKIVLYQRTQYGSLPNTSALKIAGTGSFGGPPDYVAANSDDDPGLVATNFPPNLLVTPGDVVYVAEVYSTHTFITPLQGLLSTVFPNTLYSVAYF
jgi:hypothetical protein